MAVAVQPTAESREPKRSPQSMGLVAASLVAAVFVLAAAAFVLRVLPMLWERAVGPAIEGASNSFVSEALLLVAQLASAIGLIYLGARLHGDRPATGVRGGTFFLIIVGFIGFFTAKALYDVAGQGFSFGHILLMLVYVLILVLIVQFFRTGKFTEWSLALDKGGWFDTHNYKKTQGLRVRRLTILGILLISGSGIWTLLNHNWLPENNTVKLPDGREVKNRMGDWVVGGTVVPPKTVPPPPPATASEDDKKAQEEERERVRLENRGRPRVEGGVTILPDLKYTVPLILIGGTLWFAWRVVNYPTFGDFLIATEAEINKVSWTSRRALIRDTIVVLVSLILITVFLFVVDVFWGWLLSRPIIGVLPTEAERQAETKSVNPEPVKDW
ncbi:MAG TPA: preprotein translocase subunit SecE [Gemmataceae bacterium]|nr:preprotein translocase subunit SecE [Gemmataceae bacterium]